MASFRKELPHYEKSDEYTMAYHIGALSDKRYRVAITDQDGKVLAETTHSSTQYEGCLGMDTVRVTGKNTTLFLEIESSAGKTVEHSTHNFSKNGASELFSAFFSDGELNFYALSIHIVFSKTAA